MSKGNKEQSRKIQREVSDQWLVFDLEELF
jgi:hypothetical protein